MRVSVARRSAQFRFSLPLQPGYNPIKRTAIITLSQAQHGFKAISRSQKSYGHLKFRGYRKMTKTVFATNLLN